MVWPQLPLAFHRMFGGNGCMAYKGICNAPTWIAPGVKLCQLWKGFIKILFVRMSITIIKSSARKLSKWNLAAGGNWRAKRLRITMVHLEIITNVKNVFSVTGNVSITVVQWPHMCSASLLPPDALGVGSAVGVSSSAQHRLCLRNSALM